MRRRLFEDIYNEKQKHGSAGTSLNQVASTFKKKGLFKPNTRNLDIGGGRFDTATEFMKGMGVENLVFDPFNRSADWNRKVAMAIQDGGADTVTVNNVLNVIAEDEVIENIILQAAHALKPNGVAYFLTYEGNKSGVGGVSKVKGSDIDSSFQRHQLTKEYLPFIQKYFADVSIKNKVIVAKNPYENAQDSKWYLDGTIDDDSENNVLNVRFNPNKQEMKMNSKKLSKILRESIYRVLNEGGINSTSFYSDLKAHGGIQKGRSHDFEHVAEEDYIGTVEDPHVDYAPTSDLYRYAKESGVEVGHDDDIKVGAFRDGTKFLYVARYGQDQAFKQKRELRRMSKANDGAQNYVPTSNVGRAAQWGRFRKEMSPNYYSETFRGLGRERSNRLVNNARRGKYENGDDANF